MFRYERDYDHCAWYSPTAVWPDYLAYRQAREQITTKVVAQSTVEVKLPK